MAKYCNKCGETVKADDSFCSNCGSPITNQTTWVEPENHFSQHQLQLRPDPDDFIEVEKIDGLQEYVEV